ncbi:hypothetical protein BSZ32_09565 [Rubritalea profundi]|uniref:HTH gntR-type domain-containing protein n=1 Tax=Rubritalea profundi TaxID=1658618 RepID=A0A2S7U3J6_9BACT|nr:hypothetical protein BSZ32_09565 [Rubritalea profundi]
MNQWQRLSTVDQFTAHLRAGLLSGHWTGTMPGELRLAKEFAINRKTVKAALRMLENEGLLVNQGRGAQRKIVLSEDLVKPPGFRVAILCYEQIDQSLDYLIDCKNKLETAGHTAFYAPSHLTELKMDARRIARMVGEIEADAWVVLGGTREVLEWFLLQKIPAFALFGRRRELKIAGIGPDHVPALTEATRRLIDLGHQRIVLLDSIYKFSEPGAFGGAVLDALSLAVSLRAPTTCGVGREGSKDCMRTLTRRSKSPRQPRSSPAPVPTISQRKVFCLTGASGCRRIFP